MSIAVKEFAISIEEDISNGLPPGIRVKNEIPTEESEEMSYLKEVGLPTNFGGGTILTKKGEKHTFWCDLCLVELNSLETMTVSSFQLKKRLQCFNFSYLVAQNRTETFEKAQRIRTTAIGFRKGCGSKHLHSPFNA